MSLECNPAERFWMQGDRWRATSFSLAAGGQLMPMCPEPAGHASSLGGVSSGGSEGREEEGGKCDRLQDW